MVRFSPMMGIQSETVQRDAKSMYSFNISLTQVHSSQFTVHSFVFLSSLRSEDLSGMDSQAENNKGVDLIVDN